MAAGKLAKHVKGEMTISDVDLDPVGAEVAQGGNAKTGSVIELTDPTQEQENDFAAVGTGSGGGVAGGGVAALAAGAAASSGGDSIVLASPAK